MDFVEWAKKKKQTAETTSTQDKSSSFLEWSKKKKAKSVDENYVNSFFSDATDFLSGAEKDYAAIDYNNAYSTYEGKRKALGDLNARAGIIETWLKDNAGKIDSDQYKNLMGQLSSFKDGAAKVVDAFRGGYDYYSQFASEDAYNSALEEAKQYEEMMGADLGALTQEVNDLKKSLKDDEWIIHSLGSTLIPSEKEYALQDGYSEEEYNAMEEKRKYISDKYGVDVHSYSWLQDLQNLIPEKERYINQVSKVQSFAKLTDDALKAVDFDRYSQIGGADASNFVAEYRDPKTREEAEKPIFGQDPGAYATNLSNLQNKPEYIAAKNMDDDEFKVYSYYYAKDKENGTNYAEQYLDLLYNTLSEREGASIYGGLAGKTGLEIIFGIEAGIDQFKSGLQGIFDDDPKVSPTQVASGMVREDLADNGFNILGSSLGQIAYDMTTTTSNMLPSILASSVVGMINPAAGGYVGAGLLGASAGGNARSEMLRLGYTKEQANSYGLLVGASEAVLQNLLGGISKLGGGSQGIFQTIMGKIAPKLDHALARAAIKLGGNMLDEGLEEAIQEVLDPVFKAMATGEDFEGVDLEQVLYSGLLGALSGGLFEGVPAGVNAIGNKIEQNAAIKEHGQAILDTSGQEGVDELKRLALDMYSNKGGFEALKGNRLVGTVADKATAKNVGKLSTHLEKTISKQNRADIQAALESKGLSKKDGIKATQYILGELDTEQRAKVKNNKTMMDAIEAVKSDESIDLGTNSAKLMAARLGIKKDLQSDTNSDIINESEEISNEGTDGVRLRDGSERTDGENTEESVFDLESGTGTYQGRRKSGRVADSEAARLANEGREVSVASLGILRGSANHTVRLVDAANETATMKQARNRAEARGLKVKFFAGDNLVIADKEGKLFSARGYILGDTVLVRADHDLYTSDQIVRHEIGHDMIAKGEVDIAEARERLEKVIGKENVDAIADAYAYAYAGTTLTPAEIWEECVCDSLGDMNIFTGNKELFEAMTYGLEGVKKATLSTAKESNQTRGSPEGKTSYAGRLAETANLSALDRAEQMIADGVDPETVRKETGWFKGYDGEWRFEIDDSQAEWNLDSAKPDPKRLFEFGERIFKLTDLLNHPDLYKAYPQLKKVTVWENPYASTGGYVVGKNTETFTVKSLADTNINKDILIHEIQHLIQNIEGFSTGASVDQFEYKAWGEKEYTAYEKRNEIASKLYAILRRHGVSITKSDIASVRTAFEVRDGIIDYNWMRINSLADSNPRTAALLDEYNEQVQILNLTTPSGQYHAVAGEIEAYDVQARRRQSAEERKNTRPNIDRKDAVVSERFDVSYFAKNEYDPEKAGINDQIKNAQEKLNAMDVVFKANPPVKVGKAYEAGTWAISELKKYGFQADRQGFGKIYFTEDNIRHAMAYLDTDAEKVSIVALYKVLKQGIKIGEHGNHKLREKHTITLAAPVELNGIRGNMAVVVNMRNNQYKVHRILMPDGSIFKFGEIKNDAVRETQRGVPKRSLANATSPASTSSIPQKSDLSTPSEKISSGKASRETNDIDADYNRLFEMRTEETKLRQTIKDFESSDDFKAQHDKLSDAIANDNIEKGIAAYEKWKKESGYGKLLDRKDKLKKDINQLQKQLENERVDTELAKERAAIEKSGLSEADYFRSQAVEVFGYTPYFYDAGYILPNGKMLNFSGEKGKHFGSRGEDHRAIGQVYANTQGSDALVRFMSDGNIRIMAESPGIDLTTAVEPTASQYNTISRFISNSKSKRYFFVDFTGESGNYAGSNEYEGNISAEEVIYDIKQYYKTGEARGRKESFSRELNTEDYNNYGWVRDNDIISAGHWKAFTTNFADAVKKNYKFSKTPQGEYMIEAYNYYDPMSVADVVVFAKGTIESPIVTKIIKINSINYDVIEDTRSDIYETERLGIPSKVGDFLQIYLAADFVGVGNKRGDGYKNAQNNNRLNTKRSRSEIKANPIVKFHVDEDNGTVTTTYKNGETITEKLESGKASRELDVIDYMNEQAEREGRELAKPRSNREILANALESSAQHEVEKKRLAEYKAKIKDLDAEQEKLKNLKAEIKELTFGTQKKDLVKLKALREEAVKTENRIKYYDKKLLELEAMTAIKNVLEVEKLRSFKSAMAKAREIMHENVEGRYKTVERNKIKRVAHELDALLNRGTKERNVKKGVSSVVRSALDISNMLFATDDELLLAGIGTEYTDAERAAMDEYMALYEEYHSYDDAVTENKEKRKELRSEMNEVKKGFEDVLERERKRIGALKAKGAFDNLVNEYAAMQSSKDEYISQAFKPEVLEYLRALATDINPETLVSEMSLEQIKKLYKAFAMVKKMVQDSNKIFRNGKAEDFSKLKADIFSELSTMKERFGKDYPELVGKVLNGINKFGWNNLRPVDAFDLVGSETFSGLYWDVIKAQGTYAHDVEEVGDALRDARVRHGYKKWTISDIKQFNTADGRAFELTLGERMSIYAYSKREQADEHLRVGGVQHAKGAIYKKKGINYLRKKQAAPYMIDDKLRLDIINSLSKEQRAYVDEMQAKLTEWGEKGNEASRVLYGIDLFTEKVYFPLFSSSDYLSSQSTEIGNTATTASLLSSGMTKPTTPGANNPIILRAFDDVILEHFDKMSKYHAYAVTIDNLRKTFDAQGKDSSDNMISLRTLIGSKYGVGATEYFKDYITDLNGSNNVGGVNNPLEGFFAKSKGVAVAANISVWVQQYFSVVRAMGEVNPKYFVPFLGESFKEGDMRLYEEMKKYAPVAIIKEMGGFDVGANHTIKDYIGYDEAKLTGDKAWHNFQEGLGVGANIMDKLGWLTIWKAVKKEVAAKGKYKVGSQEYFEACGKRAEEVIARTQVYDSVNSKSAFMRAKNGTIKYLVSFMGEPTTIVGMLEVATIKLSRAISTKNKAEIGKAIGKFTGVALSVAISTALTSIFKSFVYALRDNDEDEKYWEKYAHTLGEEFASDLNPLNYLPIARDIVSIWEGWDIDRPDMTLIADLVTRVKKLVYLNDDASVREKLDAWHDIALAVANLSGVPAKNVIRDIKGIYKTFENANNKYKYHGGKSFVQGFNGEEESRSEKLYNAIVGEDTKRVEHYRSTYDTDAKYQNAVRKALKENDPRIAVAAQALIDGNYKEYSDLIEDIVAEGHFSEKDVKAAIESKKNAMDETEEEKEETVEKEESIFETEYYYNALVSGDTEYAEVMREDIINAHIANGKDEEEAQNAFESSFRSYVGKMYRDGGASREDAEDLLINYCGRDENEAYWDIRRWDYVKANGSDEGYSMYNEFNEAVKTGKNLKSVIKEYTSHGKDNETLARQITSYYKPLYKEMTNRERANIKGYLLNAYALLGYDRTKKSRDIDKWLED